MYVVCICFVHAVTISLIRGQRLIALCQHALVHGQRRAQRLAVLALLTRRLVARRELLPVSLVARRERLVARREL